MLEHPHHPHHTRHPHGKHDYLPGFGHDALLPLYDVASWLLGIGSAHRTLVELAAPPRGERVLEIGCGTGNLALSTKRRFPDAEVVGIDPDPLALARATRKATRKANTAAVRFERGYAQNLPYPDGSFDLVLSAFMLHHLEGDARGGALAEARRVLRPVGALYLVDFGGRVDATDGARARWQLRNHHLQANMGEAVLSDLRAAGFTESTELTTANTRLGRITFYRGSTARAAL